MMPVNQPIRTLLFACLLWAAHPAFAQPDWNFAVDIGYPAPEITDLLVRNDTLILYGTGFNNDTEWKQGLVFAQLDSAGQLLKATFVLDSLGDKLAASKTWGKIIPTSDGGYAATAATVSRESAFLLKLSAALEVEFIREYPDTVNRSNFNYTPVETPEGYLLFGSIQRPDFESDGFIRHVDKQGEEIWFQYLAYSDLTNSVLDVEPYGDSLYVAAVATETAENTGRFRLLWLDSDGTITREWRSSINPPSGYVRRIIPTPEGDVLIFGLFSTGFVQGLEFVQPTLSKLNTGLEIEWVRHFGPVYSVSANVRLRDFASTPDGHYVGAGELPTQEPGGFVKRLGWVHKFSADQDSFWLREVPTPFTGGPREDGFLGGVGVLSSGNIIAAGTAREYFDGGSTLHPWIVKFTPDGCVDTLFCGTLTSLPEPERPRAELHVFPNPASQAVTIQYPALPAAGRLRLFDLHGRLLEAHSLPPGAGQLNLPVSHLAPGLYLLEVAGIPGRTKMLITR